VDSDKFLAANPQWTYIFLASARVYDFGKVFREWRREGLKMDKKLISFLTRIDHY